MPPQGGAVFVAGADGDFERDWRRWIDGSVASVLARHVLAVRLLGEEMKAREILRENEALNAVFEADAAARSQAAGTALLGVVASARHARLAERVVAECAATDPGGRRHTVHLATAVALHSVVFNFPPLAALLGYAFAEWRAALLALGLPATGVEAERFLQANPELGAWAGRVLAATSENFARTSFAGSQ